MKENKPIERKTSRWKRVLTFVIMFVVVAIGGLLFTGCSYRDKTFQDSGKFKLIGGTNTMNDGYFILVDKETRVMYLFVKYGYGAGLEVMVDEEGKPMLYEGEL